MCLALPYGGKCAQPYFTVAINAVNRPVTMRFKRYFSFLATLGAHCRELLASGGIAVVIITIAIVAVSVLSCFPSLTAFGATPRLIGKAFRLEELLFPSAESEGSPTIGTLDRLVLKVHWMTSSLLNFS